MFIFLLYISVSQDPSSGINFCDNVFQHTSCMQMLLLGISFEPRYIQNLAKHFQ